MNSKLKVIEFKSISPFFELCRDGKKPFDIRLHDWRDKRFRALSQVRYDTQLSQRDWFIRFTNPSTGENYMRRLIAWDWLRDVEDFCIQPTWVIMYLGELNESNRNKDS